MTSLHVVCRARLRRRSILVAAVLLLATAPVLAQECYTPKEWRPKLGSRWNRDANGNNVEDDIEALAPGDTLDILLDLNDCPKSADLARLSADVPGAYVGRYLSVVRLPSVSAAQAIALAQDPLVAMVERDHEVYPHLDVSNPTIRVRGSTTYTPDTVDDSYGLTGAGMSIAIVDSGVADGFHESLPAAKFVGGYDAFLNAETNPDDQMGHGTHVASIALGTGGPGGVFRGIAPGAALVDLQVFKPSLITEDSHVIRAIDKAIERRKDWDIRVMNMSLGNCVEDNGLSGVSQAVNRAVRAGIVTVVSSGNTTNCDTDPLTPGIQPLPDYATHIASPASADDAITVANSKDLGTILRVGDVISESSIEGPRIDGAQKPDVAAPGTLIHAAAFDIANGYLDKSGTSMSAPHVAGLAALLIQAKLDMLPQTVKKLILDTAEDFDAPGWDKAFGHGLVDAFAAAHQLMTVPKSDIRFEEFCKDLGNPVWWDSVDLVPDDPMIVEGVPNKIHATVRNNGPAPADAFDVRLGVYNYSNSDEAYPICTATVPAGLASGATVTVTCDWIPAAQGSPPGVVHACLKGEVVYAFDTIYANNCAQHNINIIQASQARFAMNVVNPTGEDLTIRIDDNLSPASGWKLRPLKPFFLAARDCPRRVDVTLIPGSTATASVRVDFPVIGVRADSSEVPLGGVSVIASRGSKCASRKIRAAGKAANGMLRCLAVARAKGLSLNLACQSDASARLTTQFARFEATGGCITTMDAAAIDNRVAALQTAVDEAIPAVTSVCAGSKIAATGRKASDKLLCRARAVQHEVPVDPACLAKAEAKFIGAFAKAELKADCTTLGDAAAIEAIVDTFVGDLVTALPPVPAPY